MSILKKQIAGIQIKVLPLCILFSLFAFRLLANKAFNLK